MRRAEGGGPKTRKGGPGQETASSISPLNTGTHNKPPRREQARQRYRPRPQVTRAAFRFLAPARRP